VQCFSIATVGRDPSDVPDHCRDGVVDRVEKVVTHTDQADQPAERLEFGRRGVQREKRDSCGDEGHEPQYSPVTSESVAGNGRRVGESVADGVQSRPGGEIRTDQKRRGADAEGPRHAESGARDDENDTRTKRLCLPLHVCSLGGPPSKHFRADRQDRQVQHEGLRQGSRARMSDTDGPDGDAPTEREPDAAGADGTGTDRTGTDRVETVEQRVEYADIAELRRELDRLEADIEDRTVHRDALEADLKQYVRRRVRRGKARGWGPYLVLLYGTAMTLGAFFFLSGVWAILALIIVWLSTLGLYALMVLVGVTINLVGLPGRLWETIRNVRD
jgi:hypothetical protein